MAALDLGEAVIEAPVLTVGDDVQWVDQSVD
jgi:hypothetical protein